MASWLYFSKTAMTSIFAGAMAGSAIGEGTSGLINVVGGVKVLFSH
jgi:hypothetical protein